MIQKKLVYGLIITVGLIGSVITTSILFNLFNEDTPKEGENSIYKKLFPERKYPLPTNDNLTVSFETNTSYIGKSTGSWVNISISNSSPFSIDGLNASIDIVGRYGILTSTQKSFTLGSLDSQETINISAEIAMDLDKDEEIEQKVDLLMVFDASGSMSEEIASVKQEFLAMTYRVRQIVPDLRIGMIVYGWSAYDEHPASSTNNYIDLTDDYDQVDSFIKKLYASGGHEPWGDALYLAHQFSWRKNSVKLIVMVGDEDCDSGDFIGTDTNSGGYYNGTQLVNVVNALQQKGVLISTVLTGGGDQVERQFEWISRATGGVSVSLSELQRGQDPTGLDNQPSSLPDLIEEWTKQLSREYALSLLVHFDWTEDSASWSKTEIKRIWVDAAPPSITSNVLVQLQEEEYLLQIFSEAADLSNISHANVYWSFDEVEWEFAQMITLRKNGTRCSFYYELSSLTKGQALWYWIEAADIMGNSQGTNIQNFTVTNVPIKPSEVFTHWMFTANQTTNLIFHMTQMGTYALWVNTQQIESLRFSITPMNDENIIITEFNATEKGKMWKFTTGTPIMCALSTTSTEPLTEITILFASLKHLFTNSTLVELTEMSRVTFYEITVTDLNSCLSLSYPQGTELIVDIVIFNASWHYQTFIRGSGHEWLEPGRYYIWIVHKLRSGSCNITLSNNPVYEVDPYYREYGHSYATSFSPWFFIVLFIIPVVIFVRILKKKEMI